MESEDMTIMERLENVTRLFLDTAPVIYYVEAHEKYLPIVEPIFDLLDQDRLTVVTSPVTLAECLIVPQRLGQKDLEQTFVELLSTGSSTLFIPIDQSIAEKAAALRAKYNLTLTDAFQAAVAILSDCDAFLTNDALLKRITELDVIVLNDLALHE
jgi:predicted nucleic acid-binding protein